MTSTDWAKLALDVSSYADHDQDCASNAGAKCSCGYTRTMNLLLRCAQEVVDREKAGASA